MQFLRDFLVSLIAEAIERAVYALFRKPTSEDEMVAPADLERRANFLAAIERMQQAQNPTESSHPSQDHG